jgi:hypothetical protein
MIKSRSTNYYHKVKDMLSQENREMLTRKFFEFHKNLAPTPGSAFGDDVLMEGLYEDMNLSGSITLDEFKENYYLTGGSLGFKQPPKPPSARFHRVFGHEQLASDKELVDVCQSLVDVYGSTPLNGKPEAVFLHTWGIQDTLPRHIDPGTIAKVTIPLYPDYDNYRELHFFDSMSEEEQPEPSHIVKYNEIRSPILLNPTKIHQIPYSETESLCLQLVFYNGYKSAAKYLSNRGLLIQ